MLDLLRSAATERPDDIAITNSADSVTFSQLVAYAEAFGRFVSGIPGKPKILLALPSGPHFTAVQIGAMSAGALAIPIPDRATSFEIQSYLRLITPDLIIVKSLKDSVNIIKALGREPLAIIVRGDISGYPRAMKWDDIFTGRVEERCPLPASEGNLPEEVTMIQFTSGSTGIPKGILLTNGSQVANLHANREHLETYRGKAIFCPVPQFHAMGNAAVLESLLFGCAVHLANDMLYGEHMRRVNKYGCSSILAPPNYYRLLLKAGAFTPSVLPSLESVTLGASSIDQGLIQGIRGLFPNLTIYCRYGVSESVGALTRLTIEPEALLDEPGLIGPLVPGVELTGEMYSSHENKITEIRVRHPANAIGYLTEAGGWKPIADEHGFLPTGDLGYLDRQKRVHLKGRISEFIKSNGYRVNPFEIEEVLRESGEVQEVSVVGVEDELAGQRIIACIELASKSGHKDSNSFLLICKQKLSSYKIPQEVLIVDRIPLTYSGKPDRKKVALLAQSRGKITGA